MNKVKEIILEKEKFTEENVLAKLKQFGVVVIPEFYDQSTINELKLEFEKLVDETDPVQVKRMDYSLGKGVIAYKNKLDKNSYSNTIKVFSEKFMEQLSDKYLGEKVDYNGEIFIVKDVVGSKHHANDMHFDVLSTFKFFIYLKDTSVENGAFTCVPGSHLRTSEIRKKLGEKISYENRELSRDLPYTQDEVTPIEGVAGTLIIFDTDVFHKAGNVSQGERWVMRGHNRINKSALPIEQKSVFTKIKSFFKS